MGTTLLAYWGRFYTVKFPSIQVPDIRGVWSHHRNEVIATALVSVILVATVAAIGGFSVWQTEGTMTSAGTTGSSYNTGTQITTTVSSAATQYLLGPWDAKTIMIQANHGETKKIYNNAVGTDWSIHVNVPSGPANVKISVGNIYHVQPTGNMISSVPEVAHTTDDSAYVREIAIKDPSNPTKIYYFYEFYYALDISFRTLAQVLNDDGTLYNIHVHEGQTAGSYGTDVSAWAYLQVSIDKNWVFKILPNYQNVTFDGGSMGFSDAWVGIMNAWYYVPDQHYTATMPEVNIPLKEESFPGHINGAPQAGSSIDLQTGKTAGYSASSLAYHEAGDFPTSVVLRPYSGNMLAGAYVQWSDWGGFFLQTNYQRSWIQAIDMEVKVTMIIDVLAGAGYTIYTGNPPATSNSIDFNPLKTPALDWSLIWLIAGVIVLMVLVAGFVMVKRSSHSLSNVSTSRRGK